MTLFLACGQSGGQPKPTRVWHGAATESLCGLWGRKTEAENQKPKGKTRKRAIERERDEIGYVR